MHGIQYIKACIRLVEHIFKVYIRWHCSTTLVGCVKQHCIVFLRSLYLRWYTIFELALWHSFSMSSIKNPWWKTLHLDLDVVQPDQMNPDRWQIVDILSLMTGWRPCNWNNVKRPLFQLRLVWITTTTQMIDLIWIYY